VEVDVRGGDDFYRLSKALKAAGLTELRKELNKELRKAAKPLIPVTRAVARRVVPEAGGLAAAVVKARQRVQVRTGAQTAGVRITVSSNRSAARSLNDTGTVRHPVHGSDRWVTQQVPGAKGWFDETLNREAPDVAVPAIEAAIEAVAERIVREAR
jgi:hypothetical protein